MMRFKTGLTWALAILLAFQTFASINNNTAKAVQLDEDAIMFTSFSMTDGHDVDETGPLGGLIAKMDNGVVTPPSPELRLQLDSAIYLYFEWELTKDVNENDYYEFHLPKEFELYNDINTIFSINTEDGLKEVAMFASEDDGKVRLTFLNDITVTSATDKVTGKMGFGSKLFNGDTEGSDRNIEFFDGPNKFIIPMKFQPKSGQAISKKGEPDQVYEGKEITWEIDINTNLQKIENAVLDDELEIEQVLDLSSIQVYALDVAIDGSLTQGPMLNEPADYEDRSGGNHLRLEFGDIFEAYRIIFTTDISDSTEGKFNNIATLSGDNITNVQAHAQTISIERGELIDKQSTGYVRNEQTIDWLIQYNFSRNEIDASDAILTDELSGGHEYITSSFAVYEVTLNNTDGSVVSRVELVKDTHYTLTIDNTATPPSFTLAFKNDINSVPYEIVYQTVAKERVFNGNTISNTVIEGSKGADASGSRSTGQGIINKSNGQSPNYNSKEVKWTITINEDKKSDGTHYTLNNAVLTDIFPNKGLELKAGSLSISGLDEGTDYQLVDHGVNGFTINFMNPITTSHTITYATVFTANDRDNKSVWFTNNATLSWDGAGNSKTVTSSFTPDTFTQQNGFKDGEYNAITKEITWDIGINYNLDEVANARVVDYFENGQELVPGTVKVYVVDLAGGADEAEPFGSPLEEGVIYSLDTTITDGNGDPGIEITFLNNITQAYWITFETTLENKVVVKDYPNTASVYSGTSKLYDLSATVTMPNEGKHIIKSGVQGTAPDRNKAKWTVLINPDQSTIEPGAVLTDTPSLNQVYVIDTFKLYEAKQHAAGVVEKDIAKELVLDVDYTLQFHGTPNHDQSFELTFIDGIDRAYVLEYESFITTSVINDAVFNAITFAGEHHGVISGGTADADSFHVSFSDGFVSIDISQKGRIEVTKVDEDTHEGLEGAEFALYIDSATDGLIYLYTQETNEHGVAIFDQLVYQDYVIEEIKASQHYHLAAVTSQSVSLDAASIGATFANKIEQNSLGDYVWIDTNRNGLQDDDEIGINDVLVELYKKDDTGQFVKIDEMETMDNPNVGPDHGKPGYYHFPDLLSGTYKIKVIPPSGYSITMKEAVSEDPMVDSTGIDSNIGNDGFSGERIFPAGIDTHDPTFDAGLYRIPQNYVFTELGDYVWIDENKDGIQDDDEPGLNGVTVELYNAGGVLIDTTTTATKDGKEGYYLFEQLIPGHKFTVKFILPEGYEFTTRYAGEDSARDSNADEDGYSELVTVWVGGDMTIDAGLIRSEEPLDSTEDGEDLDDPNEKQEDPEQSEEASEDEQDSADQEGGTDETEQRSDESDSDIEMLPQTGESTPIMPWIGLILILMALGLMVHFIYKQRLNN